MNESQFRAARDQAVNLLTFVMESWSIGIPPSDTHSVERIISDASKAAQANGKLRSLLTCELVEQIDLAVLQFPVERRIPKGRTTAHHWAAVATECWLGDLAHYFSAVRPNACSSNPSDLRTSLFDGASWNLLWQIIGGESDHVHESHLAGIAALARRARKRAKVPADAVAMIRAEAAAAMRYSALSSPFGEPDQHEANPNKERFITEAGIRLSLKEAKKAYSTTTVGRITAESSFPAPFPEARPKAWQFQDVEDWFKKKRGVFLTHPDDLARK